MPFDSIDNVLFIKTDEFDSKFDSKFHAFFIVLLHCRFWADRTIVLLQYFLCQNVTGQDFFKAHLS